MFNFTLGTVGDKRDEKFIQPITLALTPSEEGDGVDLVCVDNEGDIDLHILSILADGTFIRHAYGNFVTDVETDDNPHNVIVETKADDVEHDDCRCTDCTKIIMDDNDE